MQMLESVTKCRVCGSAELTPFFDLGEQPFANALLKESSAKDPTYPLALMYCKECALVQLTHRADEEDLFSMYVWVTGTSKKIHEFAPVFRDRLIERTKDPKQGYVLEIASNDGTLLKPFKEAGYEVLGVDPAQNIAEMAIQAGISTRADFWGAETAKRLVAEKGPARILFARNVLPHVSDQRDFVEGLAHALDEEGTLAIEVHYAGVILRELHYDSMYHEHHCYFSLKSLERLLADFGLYAFDVEKSPVSGGSIILYVKKAKSGESKDLQALREREEREQVNELVSWTQFAKRSYAHRDEFRRLLEEETAKGTRVCGWGSSARASTLLNFCEITEKEITLIADKNRMKQGLYTAGSHIPIVSVEEMLAQKPGLVCILAWNFKDEIVAELREKGFGGRVLVPFPDPPSLMP